jgi:hypothetical protein
MQDAKNQKMFAVTADRISKIQKRLSGDNRFWVNLLIILSQFAAQQNVLNWHLLIAKDSNA